MKESECSYSSLVHGVIWDVCVCEGSLHSCMYLLDITAKVLLIAVEVFSEYKSNSMDFFKRG